MTEIKKKKKEETAAAAGAELKFEEAFELLRIEAEKISSDGIALEDAIESYKKGKEYYEICSRKLQEAKQLIQIYDRESDTLKEM